MAKLRDRLINRHGSTVNFEQATTALIGDISTNDGVLSQGEIAVLNGDDVQLIVTLNAAGDGLISFPSTTGVQNIVNNIVYGEEGGEGETNSIVERFNSLKLEPASAVTEGFSATYQLSVLDASGDTVSSLGKIDIPKDKVVESGQVLQVTSAETPYDGAVVGDWYIDIVIANSNNQHIYIPAKGLVDIYTSANAGISVNGYQLTLNVKADDPYITIGENGIQSKVGTDTAKTAIDEAIETAVNNALTGGEGSATKIVSDITKEATDTLRIHYTNNSIDDSAITFTYDTAMPDELTTPNAIGGIAAGITAETLKEKKLSEVLDMILFPELNPTVTNPTASISFTSGFSNNGIYEVGAAAPTADNFSTGLNRGSYKVAGQADKFRAGTLDEGSSFIYYGGNTGTTTLPLTITLGTMQYNYHAAYGQGEEGVTSYGNPATHDANGSAITNPLLAGSVNSGAVNIFGTYPYFCNGASASSQNQDSNLPSSVTANTKLPLQKWTDTLVGAKFASEAATGTRLVFEFPSTKNVTKVEFMNTVSGKWEAFTGYTTEAAGEKQIQSNNVAYTRLTTNGSLSGALQLRFTVANA